MNVIKSSSDQNKELSELTAYVHICRSTCKEDGNKCVTEGVCCRKMINEALPVDRPVRNIHLFIQYFFQEGSFIQVHPHRWTCFTRKPCIKIHIKTYCKIYVKNNTESRRVKTFNIKYNQLILKSTKNK